MILHCDTLRLLNELNKPIFFQQLNKLNLRYSTIDEMNIEVVLSDESIYNRDIEEYKINELIDIIVNICLISVDVKRYNKKFIPKDRIYTLYSLSYSSERVFIDEPILSSTDISSILFYLKKKAPQHTLHNKDLYIEDLDSIDCIRKTFELQDTPNGVLYYIPNDYLTGKLKTNYILLKCNELLV